MKLQNKKRGLIYQQIKEDILEKISQAQFQKGESIPSEWTLSRNYQVSRQTVRRALDDLVRENHLYRLPGKGTFVQDKKITTLSNRKAENIGFIYWTEAKDLSSDLFLLDVQRGIQKESQVREHHLISAGIYESLPRDRVFPKMLDKGKIDGLLLAGWVDKDFLAVVRRKGIPFVLIGYRSQNNQDNCVLIDNFEGIKQAIKHLYDLGHCHIGFINGRGHPDYEDRLEAYKSCLKQLGIPYHKQLLKTIDFVSDNGYKATRELLKNNTSPTAILCSGDGIALAAIRAIKEKGLKVPKDISVVGFDDSSLAQEIDPPLTTVRIFKEKIGEMAVKLLLDTISQPDHGPVRMTIPAKLIVRKSCCSPNSSTHLPVVTGLRSEEV